MDFLTAHAAPINVTIDGTPYQLPRFLMKQMKEWAALRQKTALDTAMAKVKGDKEAQARILTYYTAPPIDVAQLAEEAGTPEGAEYIVRHCCRAANVPDQTIDALILSADPMALRNLSVMLASARQAAAAMKQASDEPEGREADPLPEREPTSDGSPTTTPQTSPSTSTSTETTQAA